jgi:putative NADPH-quinone reductase
MKVLVILGHPDENSFNAEVFSEYVSHLDTAHHEVQTLELGKLDFDPVLRLGYRERMEETPDISRSQELMKWAEKIVFIYPIWWASMPSLLKGWIDRVLTPGFAYNMDGIHSIGHLTGRTAELWMTSDGPGFYYRWLSPVPWRLMKHHILRVCGIKTTRIEFFGNIKTSDEARRKKWLTKVVCAAKRV